MFRNTVVYRRVWYAKRRNSKKIHIFLRIVPILIILLMATHYAEKRIISYIGDAVGNKLQTIVEDEVRIFIDNGMQASTVPKELVHTVKDENGRIISIEADNAGLSDISNEISLRFGEKLAETAVNFSRVPVGALLGNTYFSDLGPYIYTRARVMNGVKSNIQFELHRMDDKGARYEVNLHVKAKIGVLVLLREKIIEVGVELPVTEIVNIN